MDVTDLVRALVERDALGARQWVADADRVGFDWSIIGKPELTTDRERAIAAAIVELMADRRGLVAPVWTAKVAALEEPFCLVQAAETLPRLRKLCEEEGPVALRKRRLLAPPGFLTAA